MVPITKDEAKVRFSKHLNELLVERGVRVRGRRQWLSRQFNGAFSAEAARKWIEAESIPDQPHLAMLCTAFGWSIDYLMTGIGPKYAGLLDPDLVEIMNAWREIDDDDRSGLIRQLRNARDLKRIRKPVPPPTATLQPRKRKQ